MTQPSLKKEQSRLLESERKRVLNAICERLLDGEFKTKAFKLDAPRPMVWRDGVRPAENLELVVGKWQFPGDPSLRFDLSVGTSVPISQNFMELNAELRTGEVRYLRLLDRTGDLVVEYDEQGTLRSDQAWAAPRGIAALDNFLTAMCDKLAIPLPVNHGRSSGSGT